MMGDGELTCLVCEFAGVYMHVWILVELQPRYAVCEVSWESK